MAPRRICIIGDSHTAALKHGWKAIRDEQPNSELVFFSAGIPFPQHIAVEGNALIATDEKLKKMFARSSGGKIEIAADYDIYVLCGLGLNFKAISQAFEHCRTVRYAATPDLPLVSSEVFRHVFASYFSTSLAVRTLRALRKISGAPAFLLANPFPARVHHDEFWSTLDQAGDAANLVALFHKACSDIARNGNAEYLSQPEETLVGGVGTHDEFGENAERLFPGQPDDYVHMNSTYGAIVLRTIFERFRTF